MFVAQVLFLIYVFSSIDIFLYAVHTNVKRQVLIENLPEEYMNVTQLVEFHGYPCENHDVVTADGYVLSLQRIPRGRHNEAFQNKAILLQHGLLDSSATWVNNFPDQSLGFILADSGFDVWLANSRGNTYSRRHVNLTVNDAEFWNFSFDEMAKYDLPATVDYITMATNKSQIYYAGHSQGTMIAFIEFGRNKKLASKINKFFALAPVATVGHIKGALKVLSGLAPELEFLFKLLDVKDFLPNNWLMNLFADVICAEQDYEKFCADVIFLLTGFDSSNLNKTRIPVYLSHTPAGTSVKNIVHFIQLIKSGRFTMYDYGKDNMKHYHQNFPPSYNLTLMDTPVALFCSENDWLADPVDIETNLRPYLRNLIYDQTLKKWNHLDFVWGEDAHDVVYNNIVKLMQE